MSYLSTLLGMPGVVAAWMLDEAASTGTVADAGTDGHNGTVNNPSQMTQGVAGLVNDSGKALLCAGGNVTFPASNDWHFGTGDFWVALWLKTTQGTYGICAGGGSTSTGLNVGVYNGKAIIGGVDLSSNTLVNDGSTHFVVITRVSGTVSIYLDGNTTADATQTGNTNNYTVSGQFGLSDLASGYGFSGTLDGIGIGLGSGLTGAQGHTLYVAGTSSSSITPTPNRLPSNHNGNITVSLVGAGTSWTSSTTWTPSGVSGWTVASKTWTDATHYQVVLTPPGAATPPAGATGTLVLTEGVTGSGTASITIGTPTLAVSPTAANVNSSAVGLTFTATNTVWLSETPAGLITVTGGTGASIGTPSVSSDTAATATLNDGTAAGTLTLKDTSTGATASFTANPPSPPTASTLAFVTSTPTAITVNCPAFTGGNGSISYLLHRSKTANFTPSGSTPGTGTCLASITAGVNYSDATALAGIVYYYAVVGTDATPNSATTNQVGAKLWAPLMNLGGGGDSLSTGYGSGDGDYPAKELALILSCLHVERTCTSVSGGHPGTLTADWQPGSGYLSACVSAWNGAAVTDGILQLGTNDANAGVAPATFQSNYRNCINYLLANVPTLLRVWVVYPPWCGGAFAAAAPVLDTYRPWIAGLENGHNVHVIGENLRDFFSARQDLLTIDLIHQNDAGIRAMATILAADMDAILNPLRPNHPVRGRRGNRYAA